MAGTWPGERHTSPRRESPEGIVELKELGGAHLPAIAWREVMPALAEKEFDALGLRRPR